METDVDSQLVAASGQFIHPHSMVWLRRLPVGIDAAWELIATQAGLERWWIVPPSHFELRVGANFDHHWRQVVASFEPRRYLQFGRPDGDPVREVMRFELRGGDANATDFCFIDTWAEGMTSPPGGIGSEQPAGPGTPWVGVLAGWHQTVDQLTVVAGAARPAYGEAELVTWYSNYLNDHVRWRDITARPLP